MRISSVGLLTVPWALCMFSAACSRPPPVPKEDPTFEQLEKALKKVNSILDSNPSEDVKKAAEAYKAEIMKKKDEIR